MTPTVKKNRQKSDVLLVAGLLVLCLFALGGCAQDTPQEPAQETPQERRGETMGTYYRVVTLPEECNVTDAAISQRLDALNGHLSTYLDNSELSVVNRHAHAQGFELSTDLANVLGTARTVWEQTGGAFDVTIGPLVNLWGFGPETATANTPPSPEAQAAARQRVGMDLLELGDGQLLKHREDVYIDLSALAKGYAVDELAAQLRQGGCRNFMVDIGGEIYAAGHNFQGKAWRLGIETPTFNRTGQLQAVVNVENAAVATSGDYRNFRMIDGVPVDHVLDPRSGAPSTTAVASATVVHASAMWADAYATALMVLGEEDALALAAQLSLPVYLIMGTEDPAKPWRIRYNRPMAQLLHL